jgi:RecA-family ATPase
MQSNNSSSSFVDAFDIKEALYIPQLVEGLITTGTKSILYGHPNCGKSFLALHLGLCIAYNLRFFHCRTNTNGSVCYITLEGYQGLQNRVLAWKIANQIKPRRDAFFLSKFDLDLTNRCSIEKLLKGISNKKFSLIIIDTLAMAIGKGDENSATDMSVVMHSIQTIADRTNSHIMLIHHTSKATTKTPRGSSAIWAAVDTTIRITAQKGHYKIEVDKQRDLEKITSLNFKLKSITIGKFHNDKNISSAVVIPERSNTAEHFTTNNITNTAKKISQVLQKLNRNEEEIDRDILRTECQKAGISKTAKSFRSAFSRGLKELETENYVVVQNEKIKLVTDVTH